MDRQTLYIGGGIAAVAGLGYWLFIRSSSSGGSSGGSDASSGYPYFQTAALPSSLTGDATTTADTSGSNDNTTGVANSLASLSQAQLNYLDTQTRTTASTSLLDRVLSSVLQPGASNINASYNNTDTGTSISLTQLPPAPAAPPPQAVYKVVPDIAVTRGGGQITGYHSIITGYNNPVYNVNTNTWTYPQQPAAH